MSTLCSQLQNIVCKLQESSTVIKVTVLRQQEYPAAAMPKVSLGEHLLRDH